MLIVNQIKSGKHSIFSTKEIDKTSLEIVSTISNLSKTSVIVLSKDEFNTLHKDHSYICIGECLNFIGCLGVISDKFGTKYSIMYLVI